MVGRDRCLDLGAVHPEIHPRESGHHRRDPGHDTGGPCERERRRCGGSHPRRGYAPADDGICRRSLMPEWWTYRPEDFLLFSPRVYWRMFELHNEAVWPLQIVAVLLGATILVWTVRPRPWSARVIWVAVAGAWIFVGWSFLWARYAKINWA